METTALTRTSTHALRWLAFLSLLVILPFQTTGQTFQLSGSTHGLLRMLRDGKYVIVCSKGTAFSRWEADLLCGELGKPSGHSVITPYAQYLEGNDTFPGLNAVAIDFHCNKSSTIFSDCVNFGTIDEARNETCQRGISLFCTNTAPQYRVDDVTGKVEVQMNSTWSAICADSLTVSDAEVACQTLGKPRSDARPLRLINNQDRQWNLRDLHCSGSEATLEDCSSVVWGNTACDSERDVGVFCEDAPENKFRLMNGSSISAGRLEFRYKDRWGTVCSQSTPFTRQSARVLCKSLQLEYTTARVVSTKNFSSGAGVIWMADIKCTGGESSLLDCDRHFDGNPISLPCTHANDVAVSCEGLRVEDGSGVQSLQVSYEGRWADVYNGSFDLKAVTVACRALNLPRSGAEFNPIDLPVSRDKILEVGSCLGSEDTFFDCKDPKFVDPEEMRAENVTVGRVQLTCKTAASSNMKFRHPGDDSMGLYEVYNGSHWGAICGNGLGEKEAKVACRSLGFSSTFAAVLPTEYTAKGNGSVLLDGVSCRGSESSLEQCDYNPLGVVTCDTTKHTDDLNIYCGKTEDNFEVRLAGGSHKAGRVEVKVYGEWGTVCSDGFDHNAVEVVCRQLGLTLSEPRTTSIFGPGEGRVWLHMLNCTGEEETIRDCKRGQLIGERDCGHLDDIGVVCSGTVVQPVAGVSGGEIAGIVIAVLILLVILIVVLCVGIRKWSAARRDLSSNLLKTATPMPGGASGSGGRVEYNHDNGAVNMGFTDSPNLSRAKTADSNPYGRDHYDNRKQANGLDYHDDENLSPPAYHTLDVNDVPKPGTYGTNSTEYSKYGVPRSPHDPSNYAPRSPHDSANYAPRSSHDSSNYAPRSPHDSSNYAPRSAHDHTNYAPRSPRGPSNYGAPRSPHDAEAYRVPELGTRSPKTPPHYEDDQEFGFNANNRNANAYLREGNDYAQGVQPHGRIEGRHGAPPTNRPMAQHGGYPRGGSGNISSPSYDNPAHRPQPSSTRRPEPSPAYGQLDMPDGTSV